MEVNYYLNDTWYMGYANVADVNSENGPTTLDFYIEHKDGTDFELYLLTSDLDANKPAFQFYGSPDHYASLVEAFSGELWQKVKEISEVLISSYDYDGAKELHDKATMWDRLQAITGMPPVIPSPDAIAESEEAGTLTDLDDLIMGFHMQGNGSDLKRLAELLLKHSASLERVEAIHTAPTLIRYGYSECCEHEYSAVNIST